MTRPKFHRILVKLSGEALMGQGQFGIDPATVAGLAAEIAAARSAGFEVCLVVGGGIRSASDRVVGERGELRGRHRRMLRIGTEAVAEKVVDECRQPARQRGEDGSIGDAPEHVSAAPTLVRRPPRLRLRRRSPTSPARPDPRAVRRCGHHRWR